MEFLKAVDGTAESDRSVFDLVFRFGFDRPRRAKTIITSSRRKTSSRRHPDPNEKKTSKRLHFQDLFRSYCSFYDLRRATFSKLIHVYV